VLFRVARSDSDDVDDAVAAAREAQPAWADRTAVRRGDVVRDLALLLREHRDEASALVMEETGKPEELAFGETDAAVEMGLFIAGEGRRSYGRTTTASMANRTVLTVRQPLGVAALVMSFNTPLPNVAWKAFPAVFCGNAAVVKPSEHTPASAAFFAQLALEAGVPAGVLNVVHGLGGEAGAPLVAHPDVDLVSFTGSATTGRAINEVAARRAGEDVPRARRKERARGVRRRRPSRTRSAGRSHRPSRTPGSACASASRIVVFDDVYDAFRARLAAAAEQIEPQPVISIESLERMLARVDEARGAGATVLTGGDAARAAGVVPRADRPRRRRARCPPVARRALRARDRPLPGPPTSTRRSRSSTTPRTV
jgi:aldehyde dehydrogenase (NAD+)